MKRSNNNALDYVCADVSFAARRFEAKIISLENEILISDIGGKMDMPFLDSIAASDFSRWIHEIWPLYFTH
jgi:hypothetical protein